jgi:hypothetical protein
MNHSVAAQNEIKFVLAVLFETRRDELVRYRKSPAQFVPTTRQRGADNAR